MKRIGLAIAATMLGTTGVASAAMAVHQYTSTSSSSQSVALDAKTEKLAANCWVAVGGSSASACNTGLAGATASLPGLSALDQVTGLVDAGALVSTAKDVAAQAAGTATGAVTGAVSGVTGAVTGTTGAVTGVVNGVTGTVGGTLGSVTGTVGGILGSTTPNCSASGGASTGLLGISISGTC